MVYEFCLPKGVKLFDKQHLASLRPIVKGAWCGIIPLKTSCSLLPSVFYDIYKWSFIHFSGDLDLHHPELWEVVFSSDVSDRPPTMTWRYPEPRALSAVDLVPLPLSTPVLVNTLNMGEEYQVRVSCCVLLVRKFLACPQIVCYSATLVSSCNTPRSIAWRHKARLQS